MDKRFVIILLACIVAVIGVFAFVHKKTPASTTSSTAQLSEHKTGKGAKGVTLVEYGDYECPICEEYYPLVKEVVSHYGDQITFQFRNFPLIEIHKNAFAGARAAEAADLQGKFWQMHDLLYDNQPSWANSSNPTPYFDTYAQQLGLNVTKFDSDMSSSAVNDVIQADRNYAVSQGFTGTPTFLLDGEQIQNPRDVNGFYQLIDAEIAKKVPKS